MRRRRRRGRERQPTHPRDVDVVTPDAVVGNQPNGPTRRFGEVPGDDGGAARHGERATTEAEVGVARR